MATRYKASLTTLGLLFGAALISPGAHAQSQSRGELLYSTHCVFCHTTEMHWRDKKLATDWASLRVQVRRWQNNAGLAWNEADIREVTRYLNDSIYRYAPTDSVGARLPSSLRNPMLHARE